MSLVSDGESITIELFAADSNNLPKFDEDIVIPSGSTLNQNIVGLEGKTFTNTFVGTGDVGQAVELLRLSCNI